jgi:hypothetical protein
MPRSVLTGAKQHHRFQELLQSRLIPTVALEKVLDAENVKPLFNVPACVLIAKKEGQIGKVTRIVLEGTLPRKNPGWPEAKKKLKLTRKQVAFEKLFLPPTVPSFYLKYIKEGATLVPRSLWFVQTASSPYGINRERPALETSPEAQKAAKAPWQNVNLQGEVEAQYLYATILSRHLLPFGYTGLSLVVLPIEDTQAGVRLIKKEAALAKGHSGLHNWLSQAETMWEERKKQTTKSDIYQYLDYMSKLTAQHPTGYYTVVIGRPGTNVTSCILEPNKEFPLIDGIKASSFVFYEDFFIYQTKNREEAHFLCSFLNSAYIDKAIKPHQTRGAWGARHIQRLPFEVVDIPKFNPANENHLKLAELSRGCHKKIAKLNLQGKSIVSLRSKAREHLSQELAEIDKLVKDIVTTI